MIIAAPAGLDLIEAFVGGLFEGRATGDLLFAI
jgi:hypothetical protein